MWKIHWNNAKIQKSTLEIKVWILLTHTHLRDCVRVNQAHVINAIEILVERSASYRRIKPLLRLVVVKTANFYYCYNILLIGSRKKGNCVQCGCKMHEWTAFSSFFGHTNILQINMQMPISSILVWFFARYFVRPETVLYRRSSCFEETNKECEKLLMLPRKPYWIKISGVAAHDVGWRKHLVEKEVVCVWLRPFHSTKCVWSINLSQSIRKYIWFWLYTVQEKCFHVQHSNDM